MHSGEQINRQGDPQVIREAGSDGVAQERPRGWLHVVTSDAIVARPDFTERALQVIATLGSEGIFHLRTRRLGGRAHVALAQRLLDQSSSSGSLLVINDRVDIALAAGAGAVQLGRGSVEPHDVRRIAPELQIGISAHSAADVWRASDADWVIFGNVFQTATHPGQPGKGLGLLASVVSETSARVIALGGISPELVRKVLDAGASGVAVCSRIWDEDNPNSAVLHYLSKHGNASFV